MFYMRYPSLRYSLSVRNFFYYFRRHAFPKKNILSPYFKKNEGSSIKWPECYPDQETLIEGWRVKIRICNDNNNNDEEISLNVKNMKTGSSSYQKFKEK